jgi:hypothetical protein
MKKQHTYSRATTLIAISFFSSAITQDKFAENVRTSTCSEYISTQRLDKCVELLAPQNWWPHSLIFVALASSLLSI